MACFAKKSQLQYLEISIEYPKAVMQISWQNKLYFISFNYKIKYFLIKNYFY